MAKKRTTRRSTPPQTTSDSEDRSIQRIARGANLVTQVERLLREAIAEGRFPDGKLPTKIQLAAQLGVSRETVRRATETLAGEGLLVKFRRKGTFLNVPSVRLPDDGATSTLFGYVQADYRLPNGDVEPTMRHISSLILQGALEAADEADFELVVRRSTVSNLSKGFRRLTQAAKLRGIVFASVGEEKLLRRVSGLGLPIVVLDHDAHLPEINTIRDDSAAAAQMTIEYLGSLGHRRMAIAYWQQTDLNPWRLEGYRQALRKLGLPRRRKWEILTDLSAQGARFVAETLRDMSPRPTALYCFNNSLAQMVIEELGRVGLRVPEDMSVVGGGGEDVAGITDHQADWHAIGRRGVELLLAAINSPEPPSPQHQLLPHTLRTGSTTAPCAEER